MLSSVSGGNLVKQEHFTSQFIDEDNRVQREYQFELLST